MLALIAALALSSPVAPCRWYSRAERRCRDADVEYLGPWDPRPAPADWSNAVIYSSPPDFGAYPLEKQRQETTP